MNNVLNSFVRLSIDWAFSLIMGANRLNSLVPEMSSQYPPIASDSVHAIIKYSMANTTYSRMAAIKYPSGFPVSNGNLFVMQQKRHIFTTGGALSIKIPFNVQ